MPKILFTDLDDTLLNSQKQVCEENKTAIAELIDQGHKIVLTTGRSIPSAVKQAENIGLTFEGCYLIGFNGGEIYDTYARKTLYKSRLSIDMVKDIFDLAEEYHQHVQTYDERFVLSRTENPHLLRYCELMSCEYKIVDDIFSVLGDGPSKVIIANYEDHAILEKLREIILDRHGDIVDSFFSDTALLEVVSKGTSKGSALVRLCDILGVPLENTVASGDAMNDIPMIQAAHVGVAMINGDDCVKEVADYITTTDNNHGGVAEVIRKFILS
ncbi:MAG: Cof-type HAD-IIB family hydrolase [Lachnospiraceae bacterium]|nr:Cof-type HAD-IIB family hydrolase [Lachnospiraceae bacterium]